MDKIEQSGDLLLIAYIARIEITLNFLPLVEVAMQCKVFLNR